LSAARLAEPPPTNKLCEQGKALKQANGSENVAEEMSEPFCTVKYRETDQCMSMKVFDFVRYIETRKAVLRRMQDPLYEAAVSEAESPSEEETKFKFVDHVGMEHADDDRSSPVHD
jgi:hypothetical protein